MADSSFRFVVEDLALERGGRALVRGLSFSLSAGEALTVTGPNGAGKSTLLRALCGLLRPTQGRARFEGGEPPTDLSLAEGAHYFGHLNALKPALTALENVAFWSETLAGARGRGLSPLAALEKVGLRPIADLPAAYLSAGQKRRAALARLLTAPRRLWLLDEPMTALDIASQRRLEDILAEHLGTGGVAVVATHAPLTRIAAGELRLGLG